MAIRENLAHPFQSMILRNGASSTYIVPRLKMGNQTANKGLKLIITLSTSVLVTFLSLNRGMTAAQEQSGRMFEMVGMNVPFEQRTGVDDGALFAVHFTGDTHGSLDPCG